MSTVRRGIAVLTASLLLGLVLLPRSSSPARAGDPDVDGALAQQQQMEQELARQRATLDSLVQQQVSLSSDLQLVQGDLAAVGVAIADADSRLMALAQGLQEARADLSTYRLQISHFASDLAAIAVQIEQSTNDLHLREGLLQAHLRAVYLESQVSILEVLLSSQSFSQAAGVMGDMLSLSDSDQALANQIRQAREQLQVRQATLSNGRAALAALRDEAAARAAALDAQQRELDAARAALNTKKAQLLALQVAERNQLAAASVDAETYRQRIADQEAALDGQAQLVARLKAQADQLDVAYHGRFAWPLDGEFVVTQEFGRTTFELFHAGIDLAYLAPVCGGPIYAAADGVVLADGRPNLAYGDTAIGVIIGHSQRLQTWYWHLSREVVSVGQQVRVGDLIGYEGATGWATGCHLHFQVMFDGQPVNPRLYLP